MTHFILMLTKGDRTVSNAREAYEEARSSSLAYVGFKDIGLPVDQMKILASQIRADGRKVLLEVVSTSREEELQSIREALAMRVDYILGGRHIHEALEFLRETPIRYFPFCGATVGHPTRLVGTLEDIVADARRIAQIPGVHGLDLLSYRFTGDAVELTRRVVEAVNIPVLAAGSIDRPARVRAMCDANVWGFTIGSALFDGQFEGVSLEQQIQSVLRISATDPYCDERPS